MDARDFPIDCTGDAVAGDFIQWEEYVYSEPFRPWRKEKPPVGIRTNAGRILRESYGQAKQQHTFIIEIVESSGVEPLQPGHEIRRKGRALYGIRTRRQRWADENMRAIVANEKHQRGNAARTARAKRKGLA